MKMDKNIHGATCISDAVFLWILCSSVVGEMKTLCSFLWTAFSNVNDDFTLALQVERCYRLGEISYNEPSFGNIGKEHLLAQTPNTIPGNKLSQIFQTISQIFAKKWIFTVKISWSSNPWESTFFLFHILTRPLNWVDNQPLSQKPFSLQSTFSL